MKKEYSWQTRQELSNYYQDLTSDLINLNHFLFLTGIEALECSRDLLTASNSYPISFLDSFKLEESYNDLNQKDEDLTQWIFKRGIAFSNVVFITSDTELTIKTTWKEVVKQVRSIEDIYSNYFTVIDTTKQWALHYHHHNLYTFYRY